MTQIGLMMSLRGFVHMDFGMSIYGMTRLGEFLSASDLFLLDSSLLARSFACVGSALSAYGMSCLEDSLSILDCLQIDFPLSPQGHS